MVFLLRFCLALLLFPPLSAEAAPLVFSNEGQDLRTRSVAAELLEKGALSANLPYDMAKIDLNNDGVEEMIFRQSPSGCTARSDCTHIVVGLSPAKEPVILASLKARKVGIANEKAYGVRRLFVYNRQNDDFAYEILSWSPDIRGYGRR